MSEEHQLIFDQIKNSSDYFQKAKLISYLTQHHKLRIKDIAHELQLKPSYLCHIIRLNKLPELIMDGYYSELITISHLFVISLLKSHEDMNSLYEEVLRDNLSVKATEERVRHKLHNVSSEGEYVSEKHSSDTLVFLENKYNAKAKLIQTRIKTKLIIEWSGSRKDRYEKVTSLLKKLLDS